MLAKFKTGVTFLDRAGPGRPVQNCSRAGPPKKRPGYNSGTGGRGERKEIPINLW
jgi:hypothetical protein